MVVVCFYGAYMKMADLWWICLWLFVIVLVFAISFFPIYFQLGHVTSRSRSDHWSNMVQHGPTFERQEGPSYGGPTLPMAEITELTRRKDRPETPDIWMDLFQSCQWVCSLHENDQKWSNNEHFTNTKIQNSNVDTSRTRPGHVQDTSRTRRISFCLCGMGAVRALLQAVRDMDAEKLLEMAADKVKSLRLARGMGKIWKDQTL